MARNNKGFSIVEVLIIVLVLALVGFIGWKVWDNLANKPAATNDTTTQQETTPATEVESKSDLDKVDKTLDDTNVDGNEVQQLDSQVNF